ncbi:MAG: hypothetical protein QXX60_01480 [Sulfolobales archaeon]
MSIKYILCITLVLILLTIPQTVIAEVQGEPKLTNLIEEALKNPKTLIVMGIQFLMGLALGYFSSKVLKYLLALIVVLILGTALSIWSIGTSPESFLVGIYEYFKVLQPHIMALLQLLGLMTIGPITLGFIVGVLLAIIKK